MKRLSLLCGATLCASLLLWAWGADGHILIARLASHALPDGMPSFFTKAGKEMEFLANEPDRWRDRDEAKVSQALRAGTDSDHWFELDLYNPNVLPPTRYDYIEEIKSKNLKPPVVGLLPYRAMELYQRVNLGFRRWRKATDADEKRFLENQIIHDAGLLAHYVGDASMPLHTSSNYNGWMAPLNPKSYSTDRTLHARFESEFVKQRVKEADVQPLLREVTVVERPLETLHQHIKRSYAQVEPLYEMERTTPFKADQASPEAMKFVTTRLADAASVLRDLWWTAWVTSASSE